MDRFYPGGERHVWIDLKSQRCELVPNGKQWQRRRGFLMVMESWQSGSD